MFLLSASEVNNRIKNNENLTIIDIREPYEVEVCSLGFRNIPMANIVNHIEELRTIDNLVLMCRSGKRAESVANWLESDFQFSNVVVMEGGISQWKEQVDSKIILEE
jgi:adenylyltransferase/sulfurtransferase